MPEDHTIENDIVLSAQEPFLAEWLLEFQAAVDGAATTTFRHAEETRYCFWEGQSHDGRKHAEDLHEEAIPWEGARDGRYFLVDYLCRILAAACVQGLVKAKLIGTAKGADDSPKAQYLNAIVDHYRGLMRDENEREVRLCAQWMATYGLAVLQTGWEEVTTRYYQKFNMDQLLALAQGGQADDSIKALPQFIMDPEQEGAALDIAKLYFPDIPPKLLRRAIRELRTQGETQLPRERIIRRAPFVRALQVNDDVFFPSETIALEKARWIAVRVFMSVVDLREKITTEDWDKDWVDLVCRSALGKRTIHSGRQRTPTRGGDATLNVQDDAAGKLAEIIYLYRRRIDEYDVPELDLTVFCPQVTVQDTDEIYAWNGVLEEAGGRYPFTEALREMVQRRLLDSRGVPEIGSTYQGQDKAFADSCCDRLGLEVVPPFQVIGGRSPGRLSPGQPIMVSRVGEITPLTLTTGNPALGFELMQGFMRFLSAYFGIFHPDVPPSLTMLVMQETVAQFLLAWRAAYKQMARCIMANATPPELERIAGPAPADFDPHDVETMFDVELNFDVANLDTEQIWKKIENIVKILPIDLGGRIDRDKLVQWILEAIDYQAAKVLVSDQAGASQALYRSVLNDTAQMALGNELPYVELDPTAGRKLEYLQQIMKTNPQYQQAVIQNPRFKALLENYAKNLAQSAVQLGPNKVTGRTGVKPVDAATQQQN